MKVKIRVKKQGRGLVVYLPKKYNFQAGQELLIDVDDLTASVEALKVDLDAMKLQIKEELKPQLVTEIKQILPQIDDLLTLKKFIDAQKAKEADY